MTACVVFLGLYISDSLSTRASGTFTVPSVRPAFSRLGSVPVSAVKRDVLPLWGSPTSATFMGFSSAKCIHGSPSAGCYHRRRRRRKSHDRVRAAATDLERWAPGSTSRALDAANAGALARKGAAHDQAPRRRR